MKVEAFALSDKGDSREKNEDAYGVFHREQFYVVADGVGGHSGGDVAAKETVNQLFYGVHRLYNLLASCQPEEIQNLLKLNVDETNQVVINKAKAHQELKGMASTFCFVFIFLDTVYYSHYGDSRIYLLRNQKLRALTKDHTLAQELIDKNQKITHERQHNTLTQAIGIRGPQNAVISSEKVESGDIFFLCTDGLIEGLGEDDIAYHLSRASHNHQLLQEIILDARNQQAKDNITLLLLKVC